MPKEGNIHWGGGWGRRGVGVLSGCSEPSLQNDRISLFWVCEEQRWSLFPCECSGLALRSSQAGRVPAFPPWHFRVVAQTSGRHIHNGSIQIYFRRLHITIFPVLFSLLGNNNILVFLINLSILRLFSVVTYGIIYTNSPPLQYSLSRYILITPTGVLWLICAPLFYLFHL